MGYFKLLKNNDKVGLDQYLKTHSANEIINGQSLLCWAAYQNNQQFSKILIRNGANVNWKDTMNRSVLAICCFFGFYQLAKLLLENGATIDIDAKCMDMAYDGWDNHIQIDLLDLLRERGWINLYLDDLRDCPKGFTLARTVDEAISIMRKTTYIYYH